MSRTRVIYKVSIIFNKTIESNDGLTEFMSVSDSVGQVIEVLRMTNPNIRNIDEVKIEQTDRIVEWEDEDEEGEDEG